jgi:UDP-N-acetylmuramyl pentapeptide phosphotransferase/UDP-N-acetylglucosamine-1-phosphate transferase
MFWALALAFGISLAASFAIVASASVHGRLTSDRDDGVQKVHVGQIPRIGGVAVVTGVLVGWAVVSPDTAALAGAVGLAAAPVFLYGFAEDLTKRVSAATRLAAAIVSACLFMTLTGQSVRAVGVPGLDLLLAFPVVSLVITAVAMAGVTHALNIIDGLNGLASGTAVIGFSSFAAVSWMVGDRVVFEFSLVCIAAVLGFVTLNFPKGRLFLGDAGAYTIGFLLAAVAITLPLRNPEVSPLIGVLVLSYPVIETLYSIFRRIGHEGSHPGRPDHLHLHSLVYRGQARAFAKAIGLPEWRNPLASVIVWWLPASAGLSAVLLWQAEPVWLMGTTLLIVLGYLLHYRRVSPDGDGDNSLVAAE